MSNSVVDGCGRLPLLWCTASIEDVVTLRPKLVAPDLDDANPVHFVPMAVVEENFGGIDVTALRPYSDVRKGYTSFAEGDVLFAKITPCMENGKGALVPPLLHKYAFGSTEFHVLRASDAVLPSWLAYYLSQESFRRLARLNMTGSAGQLRVPSKWLAGTDIPVAPVAEQTRIVEKLEALLSDLDAGVAELRAAQRKLARYRQSVLKAAVEGALTADWRAARHESRQPTTSSSRRKPGSIVAVRQADKAMDPGLRRDDEQKQAAPDHETGAELLQRILVERRARWEATQLAKYSAKGQSPPKNWQAKYKPPVAPDTTDLPELPEGWVWASLHQMTEFVTSGSRGWADYYADSGATFIRSQNINKDWLDLSDIAFVNPPQSSEGVRTRVQLDDLLLTITGANVGKCAWVDTDLEEAYVSQHVALMRPVERALSAYLHLFLTCKAGGRGQLDNEAYGAGKPGLNLQQVLSVVVPLPNPDELAELLIVVASTLDAASTQASSIDHALKQSAAQRQNILKAAFAGQLVPQDPDDEPASALLERIRAARVSGGAKRSGNTGRKLKERS